MKYLKLKRINTGRVWEMPTFCNNSTFTSQQFIEPLVKEEMVVAVHNPVVDITKERPEFEIREISADEYLETIKTWFGDNYEFSNDIVVNTSQRVY